MGVDPDQAEWSAVGQRAMHAAPGADGAGMVAAHPPGKISRFQHGRHFSGQPGAERSHRVQRRVLCLARHAQDCTPLHMLQRRVVEHPVAAQRIRQVAGAFGRAHRQQLDAGDLQAWRGVERERRYQQARGRAGSRPQKGSPIGAA